MYKNIEGKLNNIKGFIFEINKNSGTLASDIEIIRNSVEFNNWYTGKSMQILFSDMDRLRNKEIVACSVADYYSNIFISIEKEHYVPVGSIEFVELYMGKEIKTINPLKIFSKESFKREIRICGLNEIERIYKELGEQRLFIKDAEGVKKIEPIICNVNQFNNWHRSQLNAGINKNRKFIVSSVIDIQAEWRCFVYNGKICGCQQYIGEFWQAPNLDILNNLISQLNSKIRIGAFTIDIGVNNSDTFLIEMHNLISCGLYGFESQHLYKMTKLAYVMECTGSLGGVQVEKES